MIYIAEIKLSQPMDAVDRVAPIQMADTSTCCYCRRVDHGRIH
jgi:hypothetical protein